MSRVTSAWGVRPGGEDCAWYTAHIIAVLIMRHASESSLFVLGFPRGKKPLHNGSYEHRVPKKKKNIILEQVCVCGCLRV